ncbi:hypothetical protein E3N88_43290 [Mikania micrantha]|uniref:Peptidase metallopeptidase domain-containing protein n=1 Tax=Mikania micrantha TaxID=192012 RepID=A0A5N6LF97_9ASTR|nr:hypothetical protein E3N88_43290 [Mikania micrantha]
MPPVASAFRKWASATQYFTFSRTVAYQSADLKIRFARQDHGDGFPFDGPGGVLAHAFAPTRGLFHFDADNSWAIGAVPNAFDVESVALHEIGHLLGLDHSQYESAIMWSTLNSGETKGLDTDDIQGVQALYGIKVSSIQMGGGQREYSSNCQDQHAAVETEREYQLARGYNRRRLAAVEALWGGDCRLVATGAATVKPGEGWRQVLRLGEKRDGRGGGTAEEGRQWSCAGGRVTGKATTVINVWKETRRGGKSLVHVCVK